MFSQTKDSRNCPEPAPIKTDSADRVMFADSIGIQIDSSKLVDTRDGLLVKDAVICRAMVLDYNGKKILKSPEALTDSMPTMQRMMITDEHPRSRVIMDVSEIKGRVLPETVALNNNVATGDLLITDKVLAMLRGRVKWVVVKDIRMVERAYGNGTVRISGESRSQRCDVEVYQITAPSAKNSDAVNEHLSKKSKQ